MLQSSTWMSSHATAAPASALRFSDRLRVRLALYAACTFAVACSAGTYAYLVTRL